MSSTVRPNRSRWVGLALGARTWRRRPAMAGGFVADAVPSRQIRGRSRPVRSSMNWRSGQSVESGTSCDAAHRQDPLRSSAIRPTRR